MTDTDTLLPCPFCGGEAAGKSRHTHEPAPKYALGCVDCFVATEWQSTPTDANAAWNRRTPPTPATDVREAVAQWCSGCQEVRSVDCYRADCPKSDTERRAAEILAAERERDALREALRNALASLVAATSLLERGGKKAAPSDKMFAQMLVDYNKSAAAARAALTANHSEHGAGK